MGRRFVTFLVIAVCLLSSGCIWAGTPVDDAISRLKEITNSTVGDWKYEPSDAVGAQDPAFDDSKWRTGNPEFEWGQQAAAWLRKTVVIPEALGGIPVAGSSVVLRLGIDDDGECYVNGELKQKFHWGDCKVTLTEKAMPGDKYVIAVKGTNTGGPGRLLFATLDYSVLDDLRVQVDRMVGDLTMTKLMAEREADKDRQAECRRCLDAAVRSLDIDLQGQGSEQRLAASLPAAQKALEPIRPLIKEYTVHLIGHAHIDMNWLWLWPETVDVCRNTFSTMQQIMKEYPDFRFSQSQAATYLTMEEQHPEIFQEIRKRVRSGQWEVNAATWVEGDMNMASGESIVRQLLYANRYLRDKFGVKAVTCWEPDTFGHAWTVPQILAKSGIRNYYFCRCGKDQPAFWWEAPDGSRVLAYNKGWYSEHVNDNVIDWPFDLAKRYGVKDAMVVYGVGDHGGGPTRDDVNKAIDLQKRDVCPNVKFDTTAGFFDRLAAQGGNLPIVRDELNFEFRGCYTAHSDIKKMNRVCENLLPAAETFSAIAGRYGFAYPRSGFVTAWRNTCFNQFHDIFDGTAIHGSYDYSRDLYNKARGVGHAALDGSLRTIVSQIDTRGTGIPLVVFNPLSWDRTDVVRIPVPPSMVDRPISLWDSRGREVPFQVLEGRMVFTARDIPAIGYRTFYARAEFPHVELPANPALDVLENEFFRVHVDISSGTITSVLDKKENREVLAPNSRGDVLQLLFESPRGMSSWNIGEIKRTENLESADSVTSVGPGILRIKHKYNKSTFVQDVIVHPGVPRIDFRLTADWYEQGSGNTEGPMLKVAFPVNVSDVKDGNDGGNDVKARFDIPFGSIERPAKGDEVPALKWVDLSDGGYGVSLLNDCKYGHDVKDKTLRLSLLRCSYDPDPKPDQGRHEMAYSLYPHSGDWTKAGTARRGFELNNPLIGVWGERHTGRLPEAHCFLKVKPSNLIVTALKKAEDSDDLILRFYESEGTSGTATIETDMGLMSMQEVDLMEQPVKTGAMRVIGGRARVPFGKWEIKTYRLSVR